MKKYCGEEYTCIIDGRPGADLHHVKSRGSGGTDDPWNLIPICHLHHTECHVKGMREFSAKYQEVRFWLRENNWEFNGWKWVHTEPEEPSNEGTGRGEGTQTAP